MSHILLFSALFIPVLVVTTWLRRRNATLVELLLVYISLALGYQLNGQLCVVLPLAALFNYYMAERLRLVVAADLLLLAYFKYAGFLSAGIIMPVGLSFFTFQAISYAVDLRRGVPGTRARTFLEYLTYLTFFPLLMAGPITRARHLIPRLRRMDEPSSRMVWTGLWLVGLGLIKKFALADYLGQYNAWVFDAPETYSGFENMMALLGFPVQLYLDFSGYSDLAIGLSTMLGFPLPDNFRSPFRATSITAFWRRWHISLSTWLRDYLYIPLGGNRRGTLHTYLNLFLTMLLGGIWHGATLMFALWGALHGVGLVVHKWFARRASLPAVLAWPLTYAYVALAFVFFRAPSLDSAGLLLRRAFTAFDPAYLPYFWRARALWLVLTALVMLSYLVSDRLYRRLQLRFIRLPWLVKLILLLAALAAVRHMSTANIQPFIYNQF